MILRQVQQCDWWIVFYRAIVIFSFCTRIKRIQKMYINKKKTILRNNAYCSLRMFRRLGWEMWLENISQTTHDITRVYLPSIDSMLKTVPKYWHPFKVLKEFWCTAKLSGTYIIGLFTNTKYIPTGSHALQL